MSEQSRIILKSKIHRATVTHADLHYEGSVTIPPSLLKASDILAYEKVAIWNVTQGTRLETYAITGEEDGNICINGAAAHRFSPADLVIIASFVSMPESKVKEHKPKLVFVDENNQIKELRDEIAGPKVFAA